MLWACLDDSAIHLRPKRTLYRYALGGAVASLAVWQELLPIWRSRLSAPGNPTKLSWFHFKEWQRAFLGHAKEGDLFYGWTQRQLKPLLTDLADIISKREIHYLCASVPVVKKGHIVRDSYKEAVELVIKRAQKIPEWLSQTDKVSFLLSTHSELPNIRIHDFFEILKRGHPGMAECVFGDPRSKEALQVADLIVYHTARSRRMRMSYGPQLLKPFMTEVMEHLNRHPPHHHMIEWHVADNLEANQY
jgi:hypothetical protein